jgi:hypothetical protein
MKLLNQERKMSSGKISKPSLNKMVSIGLARQKKATTYKSGISVFNLDGDVQTPTSEFSDSAFCPGFPEVHHRIQQSSARSLVNKSESKDYSAFTHSKSPIIEGDRFINFRGHQDEIASNFDTKVEIFEIDH